jgi:hypothetical protein
MAPGRQHDPVGGDPNLTVLWLSAAIFREELATGFYKAVKFTFACVSRHLTNFHSKGYGFGYFK